MLEGKIVNLREPNGVIVNDVGAGDKLASPPLYPGGPTVPMKVGDLLEINDVRARVVGICKVQRTFQSQPVVYTTFNRAISTAPVERNLLSFIIVKAMSGVEPKKLARRIEGATQLAAYTNKELKRLTIMYYVKKTGILINFGFAVILGFIIGTVIAGQMFYNFALDNQRYFAACKAMGASDQLLKKMIIVQSLMVGALGWGFGIGLSSLFGIISQGTELSFVLPWWLFILSAFSIFFITLLAAFISIWKISKLEPAIVFQS